MRRLAFLPFIPLTLAIAGCEAATAPEEPLGGPQTDRVVAPLPTVVGEYTWEKNGDTYQDVVSAVLTSKGPKGIINHLAGPEWLGLDEPFRVKLDCMKVFPAVGDDVPRLIGVASAPLNEVYSTRYVVYFYEDYKVSIVSMGGPGENFCTSFGFNYAAFMNYGVAVPITDGHLQLIFPVDD